MLKNWGENQKKSVKDFGMYNITKIIIFFLIHEKQQKFQP